MLQATTLLGDNTIPILNALVAELGARGLECSFDTERPLDEREQDVRNGGMDLVFACGLLTMEMIRDGAPIDVIAAPLFPGERSAVYRSAVIVRADSTIRSIDEAVAGRLAVNEYGSWSGWRAWEHHLDDHGHHADEHPTHIVSGGHTHSMAMVRSGVADVAAIDSSIWAAAADADRSGLVIIDQTRDWPAPPLSIRAGLPVEVRATVERFVDVADDWERSDGTPHQVMLG